MITDLNDPNATAEISNIQSEPRHLQGFYDPSKDAIDYTTFVQKIVDFTPEEKEKCFSYLSTNLLSVQEDPTSSKLTTISYMGTDDRNVSLMQKKLDELGALDIPMRDQNFYAERSMIISTFRCLQIVAPILGSHHSDSNEFLVNYLKKQLSQQITVGEENAFREEVKNWNDQVLYHSKDADLRKSKEYININGKITEKEMGFEVLPRVIKVLKNVVSKTSL